MGSCILFQLHMNPVCSSFSFSNKDACNCFTFFTCNIRRIRLPLYCLECTIPLNYLIKLFNKLFSLLSIKLVARKFSFLKSKNKCWKTSFTGKSFVIATGPWCKERSKHLVNKNEMFEVIKMMKRLLWVKVQNIVVKHKMRGLSMSLHYCTTLIRIFGLYSAHLAMTALCIFLI